MPFMSTTSASPGPGTSRSDPVLDLEAPFGSWGRVGSDEDSDVIPSMRPKDSAASASWQTKKRNGNSGNWSSGEEEDSEKENSELTPVILANPDGSMSEGVPPGYKEKEPWSLEGVGLSRSSGGRGLLPYGYFADTLVPELDPAFLYDELTHLILKHQQVFALLLFIQFAVEAAFFTVSLLGFAETLQEVQSFYPKAKKETLLLVLSCCSCAQVLYLTVYYALGLRVVVLQRPKCYADFAGWCLFGVLAELLLAPMTRFNLFTFFLRFLAYLYAKFLKNFLRTVALIPPPVGNGAATTASFEALVATTTTGAAV